ncbi:hypothetical protein OC835_003699 [Tilletia horrida]|nr:hypothetical protein OC835_003699 [Tilletia horrida]
MSSKSVTELLPNSTTVFRAWPQSGIYTFSRPFARFGVVPIGGRTTIIRMTQHPNTDALFVLASTPADEPTKQKVSALLAERPGSKVAFLAAADYVHSLYLQEWAAAYPDALIVGVEGLEHKNPAIASWHGIYGRDPPSKTRTYAFEPEIQAAYFPTFTNKDVVFHHTPTRTLLTADLLFNLPVKEQYANTPAKRPTSWIPFLSHISPALSPHRSMHQSFLWSSSAANPIPASTAAELGEGQVAKPDSGGTTQERRHHFANMAALVAGWNPKRIVMCHGEVIDDDDEAGAEGAAKSAWIAAFGKFLNPDGTTKV